MEILDPKNFTVTVKIEYNPCVICLQSANIPVDFNTAHQSETSEISNYFTNGNNESLLKLLTIGIDRPNARNRSKSCFLNSHDDNDVALNKKFRNLDEENPDLFVTIEKEKHQEGTENKAHFYCDSCFLRNKEILQIYSEIEKLHNTFNCLRDSIEGAFKGGWIDDDGEKFCEPVLGDSDFTEYWRTLRHQFAKSFKLVLPQENYTENQDLFDYSENPPIPSPSQTSPNSDFNADSSINIQYFHPMPTQDPRTSQQGSFENCMVELDPTSTTTQSSLSLLPSSKEVSTSTSNSKISNSNLKNVIISIKKLPDHIRPNIPILINQSQTYPADLHRQQPLRKILEPEPAECESSRLRPTRNCVRNRAVKSYNVYQRFSSSENDLSDSDVNEKHETDVKLSDNQEIKVEDIDPPKKKRKPPNTKREEKKKDANSSSMTVQSTPKPPRFFCTVKDCKRRKGFSSQELLDIHTKESHEEVSHPFKCPEPECVRSFRKFRDYKSHIDTTHNKKYKYICHHCGKGFGISKNLRSHLGVHNTEARYKCPDCPKALRSRAGLLAHRRTAHTGERPYQCDFCGKSFVSSFKLKNHIQCIHNKGDRPYVCPLCNKTFPIQGYLYFHMTKTHGKVKPGGDPDAAAADQEEEEPHQQSQLGAQSEQIISKSATTVILPVDYEAPRRIPYTPPHVETPVAPYYSYPLPLLPLVDETRSIPAPAPVPSSSHPSFINFNF